MKFLAVIQARLASTRLPHKVLDKVYDKTIIEHIIARLSMINNNDFTFCFAIAEEQDRQLADYLEEKKVSFISGSEYNVLARFEKACQNLSSDDYIFRLTADNPFIDYKLMSKAMSYIKTSSEKVDYLTYANIPLGMGFELIRVEALLRQKEYPLAENHYEHVTVAIREYQNNFHIVKLRYEDIPVASHQDLSIRLTCDTPDDLAMLNKTAEYFGNQLFCSQDVYDLYQKNVAFFHDNLHVEQRCGKSFQKK